MYFILKQYNSTSEQFVKFWSSLYVYPSGNYYTENISKTNYTSDDLQKLFIWKNGMRLSDPKYSSLERKILHRLELINRLKSNFLIDEFNRAFSELSTIWKIFLLHCIKPNSYPIFDQHVFRAMRFIQTNTIVELPKSKKEKYSQYLNLYLSFFDRLVLLSGQNGIEVDHALWVFGKSLKTPLLHKVLNI